MCKALCLSVISTDLSRTLSAGKPWSHYFPLEGAQLRREEAGQGNSSPSFLLLLAAHVRSLGERLALNQSVFLLCPALGMLVPLKPSVMSALPVCLRLTSGMNYGMNR